MPANESLRALPSLDKLLSSPAGHHLIESYSRDLTVEALRSTLEDLRTQVLNGAEIPISTESILEQAALWLEKNLLPTLRPVINATGVIIHTNLGRAPLSKAAQQAMIEVGTQYNTLEFDLESGKRGSRLIHAEALLREITGAEAALVVNNNAAALVLLLATFARGREVILSRGQLVEIGGGFRIPEIMEQSGARLVEVGTTNRTRAADYARAVSEHTAMLMRVHSSNFKQIGFVEEAPLDELAQIAHEKGLILVDDLGSGALLDTAVYGLEHEPTAQESLLAGAQLVAFSGDKLLGGPQAGILVGTRTLIDQLRRHPLARALRADKLCYAALGATLTHYRKGEAAAQIPIWQMISRPLAEIQQVAQSWAESTGGVVIPGESTVGGGSLPGATLPTALFALKTASPDDFLAALRRGNPPVIGRIVDDLVVFDPRTVLPEQEAALLAQIRACLGRPIPDTFQDGA